MRGSLRFACITRSQDHICNKCRKFSSKAWKGSFLQQFEDGIKSYFVKIDSFLLHNKE